MSKTSPPDPAGAAVAPTCTEYRQQVLATSMPMAVTLIVTVIAFYGLVHVRLSDSLDQILTFSAELAIPITALLLVRTRLQTRVESVLVVADLLFTAILATRLILPSATVSGVALFLVLKQLATAALLPWRPRLQYASSALTVLAYFLGLAISGREVSHAHQLVGPPIAAVLACVGATLADRTRRDLWRRTAALADSERETRRLLESERVLTALAREISVLTDLRSALDRVNSLTAAALGCEVSTIYLIDEKRGVARAASTSAREPTRAHVLAAAMPIDWVELERWRDGRALVVDAPQARAWLGDAALSADHSLALAPLRAKSKLVGALTAVRMGRSPAFDAWQIALLEAIAAHAAIAIENAQLFDGLVASEASYRDLFERATDLIFVVDEGGGVRFANRAALDFVGVDAECLGTLGWQELLTPESRRLIARRMTIGRRRRTRSEGAFEVEVHRLGGAIATLEVRARRISPCGQPRTYQCIARDATERRRQERESQELLSRLREANRLQGEFVANMSHELRTPLNVIIGYADLLADEPDMPTQGDARLFLQRIAAAGRSLHRLVESVLEYARLDRGRAVLIPRRFAADELLGALSQLGRDVRRDSSAAVRVQARTDLVLRTDYDRLYSVLSNLLLNAIKFTPDGSVELTVHRDGAAAEFTVRDTGIGIEKGQLSHVFEPFRQADGSPTRNYGGVGLGLAIVQRNVELLGGTVDVDSVAGAGSTFRVRVPLDLADAAAIDTASAA
ncbi:MAG: ATP-binding protein [Candidatus Binatia bacterium]